MGMQLGVVLSPTGEWPAILRAARLADEDGLAAVGFWDHYHSERPEWAMVCGWAAYGALAAATTRIRLTPLVLCQLNYRLGVLAKESAVLSLVSGGRFELGIGAGDYPAEFAAWHQPFPPPASRVARLAETVAALRRLWQGGRVTVAGEHVRLTAAACTPAPPVPPRVVVGVGGSRRLLRSAVAYADELNLYPDPALLAEARRAVAASGRAVALSVYVHLAGDAWPADLVETLKPWAAAGAVRAFVNAGYGWDLSRRVAELAEAQAALAVRG
jgi:alkanesulfonate monooxygenase SsuD/methylene tetrahydromethanopterin reductase-like flavin-dependent oxidoreductase (luciferase family)